MKQEKQLNQVNTDIVFFFLTLVASFISFYLINEKKKSILKIKSIDNKTANKIYKFNRRLFVVIDLYFLLNAYYYYNEMKNNKEASEEDFRQAQLLFTANIFLFISACFYLPLGNSNLIIEN